MRHARVSVHGRASSREKDDVVTVFAEEEVKATCALEVGCAERGGEAERGHESLAELGDGVDEGGALGQQQSGSPPTREERPQSRANRFD